MYNEQDQNSYPQVAVSADVQYDEAWTDWTGVTFRSKVSYGKVRMMMSA